MNFTQEFTQLGIVGGGINAVMLCNEAAKLGIKTTLLDPDLNCVGAETVNEHIIGAITPSNIEKLVLRCNRVIINTDLEFKLETKAHKSVFPAEEGLNILSNFTSLQSLLEELEIPTPHYYYQDISSEPFANLDNISLPFKIIKQFKEHSKEFVISSTDDLADFILETGDNIESFAISPITAYKEIVTFTCIYDAKKHIYAYEPMVVYNDDECLYDIDASNNLTKTMLNRLTRYNKKLLQELNNPGCYTIRYGINKSPELIDISPVIPTQGLITNCSYDISIYKQYLYFLILASLPTPRKLSSLCGYASSDEPFVFNDSRIDMYNLGDKMYYIKQCEEV